MISNYIFLIAHPGAGVVLVLTLAASHSLVLAGLIAFLVVVLTYSGALAIWHRNAIR